MQSEGGPQALNVSNQRLKRAIKLLFYFSEIFPKKHQEDFQSELVQATAFREQSIDLRSAERPSK